MSAATDKARFFLEQSVPELKELEKKQIFTKVCTALWFPTRFRLRPTDKQLLLLFRMRSVQLSRSVPTSNTSSMREAPDRGILYDTLNMR